jgi:hypothetical protein
MARADDADERWLCGARAAEEMMGGNIVNLHNGIDLDSDAGRELIVDLVRYAENILTEKQVRKRHRLPDSVWKSMADDDLLVEKVEAEKLRRIRDGSSKREKAQLHVTKAPDVLESIMMDDKASAKHRIDSAVVLDKFAANGPQGAPAADRFIIQINLGEDVLRFNKSIKVDANDVDPNESAAPQGLITAITTNKDNENDE